MARHSDTQETSTIFLTIGEAAAYLRCSPNTVGMWLAQGRLPRHKAGRRTLLKRADLDAFVTNETPAHPPRSDAAACA